MRPGRRSFIFCTLLVSVVIYFIIGSFKTLRENNPLITDHHEIIPIPPEIPDPVLLQHWKAHTQNCYNHTITVYIPAGGRSYSIRCLLLAAHYALQLNRTLFLAQSKPNELKWETFFEPVSPPHCKLPPPAINQNGIPGFHLLENSKELEYVNEDHVWLDASLSCPLWNKCKFMEGKEVNYMFRAVPLVFRLNKMITLEIEKLLSVFPNWSTRTFHAIHIRRGDKVFGHLAEAKYLPTEEFCQNLEKFVGEDITDPVFIAADSVSSIEEVKKERKNWTVWSITVPRYEKLREGNFSHSNFSTWPEEDRIFFYKMFLAETVMMRFAKNFVGTGTSNVWQLLNVLRNSERIMTIN